MIKVEHSLVIMRPIEEVFAFHDNPENLPKWESGVLEYKQTSEGPIGVGATFREVRKFLGRRVESTVQITEYVPHRKVGLKSTSRLLQFEAIVTFESVEGGTRVNSASQIGIGGFFKVAEPILRGPMQRLIEGNLANLKDLLEARAGARP